MAKNEQEPEILEPRKPLIKDLLSTLLSLALMAAVVLFILNYVGSRISVDGTSMYPTLHDKDQLIEDKLTYSFIRKPERFEIVIFRPKNDPGTYYIKRVIGLPGETVQIIDSVIYINGESLEENYGQGVYFLAGSAADPVVLGDDEYFVLGDNRNNSIDSRYAVGKVKREQITGRAVFRFWPFSSFGSLKGR